MSLAGMVSEGRYRVHWSRESRETGVRMSMVLGFVLAISVCLASAAYGANGFSDEVEEALKTESYIYVATRRLSGEWSAAAPVWFMYDGNAVYFTTAPTSHKAHRIHRGNPVRIWVGKKDG